jgi:cytochrome c-type biogenesis protein CcmE
MTLTEQPLEVTPIEPSASRSRSGRRSLVVIVVLVAAVIALLGQGLLSNLNYFETVNQAMSHRGVLGTNDFRLEGLVAKGTVNRTANGASFFLSGRRAHEIFVVAHGQPPQLFQSDIPVVVDGHFTTRHSLVFDASQIIVKHSASYVAQYPNRVKAPNGSTR